MTDKDPRIAIRANDKTRAAFASAKRGASDLTASIKETARASAALVAAVLAVVKATTAAERSTIAYSEALGVSTENMSRWEFAAESVGLAGDKVGDIMKDAADKIGDAYRNNAGEAKEAIESLGLDLETLANMKPDQQLLAIAGALDSVGTKSEKVQIMESIGNDFSLMLPLLEDGAAGLKEAAAQADELGRTLTGVEAEKIKIADESVRKIEASMRSMGQSITTFVSPALADFTSFMARQVPRVAGAVNDGLNTLAAAATAVWEAMNPSDITGSVGLVEAYDRALRGIEEKNQEFLQRQRELRGEGGGMLIEVDTEKQITESLEREWQVRLNKQFAFEDAKTRLVRSGNIERLKFETLTAQQQTAMITGELVAVTRGVAQHNRGLFELNKAAAIPQAFINMRKGISRTLAEYPWPWAGVMAAAHAAAGFAEIQAIEGASFSGGGGAPSLAGSGGTPANPVFQDDTDIDDQPAAQPPAPLVNITVLGDTYMGDDFRQALGQHIQDAIDLDELPTINIVRG